MKRRDFIQYSSIMSAGILALPGCTVAVENKDKKNIGVQLYTVRDEMSKDAIGTLKSLASIGFKELESAGYCDGMYYGMKPAEFRKILDDHGLTMPSGHYLTGNQDPEIIGTLNNGWEQAVEDALAVGQKYMVLAYLFDFERERLDQYKELADIMNTKADIARQAGIQFCYHNHDFEFQELEGEIPMEVVLNETDKELVKMELDLYWINKVDQDPVAFFSKYPKRTPLWHVKDMDNSADRKFTEVGNGVIDFKTIFKHADKSGMKHFFVEQDVCEKPPLESLSISHKYVSGII